MEKIIAIMKNYFEHPETTFHIREIARLSKMSHTAARIYHRRLEQDGYLTIRPSKPYPTYRANTSSRKYLNLKLFYNLEKLANSGIIEILEKHFNYPTITVFGSFAKAMDNDKSDIDIFILSEIDSTPEIEACEKKLNRNISLHLYNKKQWKITKAKNPGLVNSICNGFVLSGELEVL